MKPLLLGVAPAFIALTCAPLRHPHVVTPEAPCWCPSRPGMGRIA
ncbi:MAG TPA: hypothetical protein PLC09_09500 [Holophaga sp.]|nr:hypothetical protein [Holophaga sp.]